MEIRDKNNFYAVPLMGGILCIINLFFPTSLLLTSPNLLLLIMILTLVILEEVCGTILIVLAVKLKRGKTTWMEQEKRLLILSSLAFIAPIVLTVFISINIGYLRVSLVYGLTGGFIIILGVIFSRRIADDDSLCRSPTQESVENKIQKSERTSISIATVCSKCGTDLKETAFKFCPECGNELS